MSQSPETMRAALVESLDGPAAVRVHSIPAPRRGPGQLLVRVRAAGVAFPALLQTRGRYQTRPELPFVPGSEIAGEVIEAGEHSGFTTGDRVMAFCRGGGFAEIASPAADHVFPLPPSWSYEAGAAFPMNHLTAHFAVAERGRLRAGERVLVHGAAGGLGTACVQLAKALGAAHVVAVVSTPAKGAVATAAGADAVVPAAGFKDAVLAGGRVDLVLDPVGGDRFPDSLRCLAPGGRIVVLGFTGGAIPELKVNRLLLNNVGVLGAAWGPWALAAPSRMKQQWCALEPHLHAGALTPLVGSVHRLDDVVGALEGLDLRKATGKVVLVL